MLTLAPPCPDSVTQHPRQGLCVVPSFPPSPWALLATSSPEDHGRLAALKPDRHRGQTLRSCRVQHTLCTGISKQMVYFGFGRAAECHHLSASKKNPHLILQQWSWTCSEEPAHSIYSLLKRPGHSRGLVNWLSFNSKHYSSTSAYKWVLTASVVL